MGEIPKVQDALSYLEKVKSYFCMQPYFYTQFLEIMKDFQTLGVDTEGVIARVQQLFSGNEELIQGFNQFLPPVYKIQVNPVENKIEFDQAVKFVAKVKARFADDQQIYENFLECLHLASSNDMNNIDLVYARIQQLFNSHPDLLEEFIRFLPETNVRPIEPRKPRKKYTRTETHQKRTTGEKRKNRETVEKINTTISEVPPQSRRSKRAAPPEIVEEEVEYEESSKRIKTASNEDNMIPSDGIYFPSGTHREVSLFEKMRNTFSIGMYFQLLKCIHLLNINIIGVHEFLILISSFIPAHSDFYERIRGFLGISDSIDKEKVWKDRSNYYSVCHYINTMGGDIPTPSYRALPPGIKLPICSYRTPLCDEVINDSYRSVCQGSEDSGNFKITRKNQYEEALFQCEDERFEIDLMIETTSSAIVALENIFKKLQITTLHECINYNIFEDETLSPVHIRCIHRLFYECGSDIIDYLKRSPSTTIPILVNRMRKKVEEWKQIKQERKQQWRDVMEKNYSKSLDHRSFYFKQDDKKRMKTEILKEELIRLHEEKYIKSHSNRKRHKRNQESQISYFSLFYSYSNPQIHQDIQHLLQLVCQKDQLNVVMDFWYLFFQPFFGLNDDSIDQTIPSDFNSKTNRISNNNHNLDNHLTNNPFFSTETNRRREGNVMDTLNILSNLSKTHNNIYHKPISINNASLDYNEQILRKHTRPSNLFFCNWTFYVVFRYHQFLYARLQKVQNLSKLLHETKPSEYSHDLYIYECFVQLLSNFFTGKIEFQVYEDECRNLMGVNAFEFIPIDKLVLNMAKQVRFLINNSSICGQLLSLYHYESLRVNQYDPSQITPSLRNTLAMNYYYNLAQFITEEYYVMIEYFFDTCELGIALMNKPTNNLFSIPSVELALLMSPLSDIQITEASKIVLKRNIRQHHQRYPSNDKSFHSRNNLEYFWGPSIPLSAVEETNDFGCVFPYSPIHYIPPSSKKFHQLIENSLKQNESSNEETSEENISNSNINLEHGRLLRSLSHIFAEQDNI